MIDATEAGGDATAVVAVAVKCAGGRGSRRAVKWAVEKLNRKADRFVLVHVMPPVTAIPTPSGRKIPIGEMDAKVVDIYVEDMKAKSEELFTPFKKLMKRKKMETMVLIGDNPASTLLTYIFDMGISTLIVGACSSNISCFRRKTKGSRVPAAILKNALPSSNIFVVDKHRIISNAPTSVLAAGLNNQKSSNAVPNSKIATDSSSLSRTSSQRSDIQAEVNRLRQDLQSTLAKYNQACEDLVYAQNKVSRLSFECQEEERRVSDAQRREENLRKIASREKEKHLEAIEEVEKAKNQCAREVQKRQIAELRALKESLEKQKVVEELFLGDNRYKRYNREEIKLATNFFSQEKLLGEGAYGKVYKCNLYHTPVAVKVLSSDSSDKKEEFLKEIEVLSQLRHPHIVLLLGACPEGGCLVYEYMENGSLEDYLLPGSSKPPLPWSVRFRITYEVACGLAFLHNSKPAPIVHRDLKPGNILLGRNFVSKIGDAGLAKIISEVVPDNVTEYRNSMIAGTLYYLDPEYQRTGSVRPKSDLYALGVIILQLLAGSHPNGLILKVEKALRNGALADVLDKSQTDWPLHETEELARVALRCCKLRCRDRPDLDDEVLPVLKRLARFADVAVKAGRNSINAPNHYYCPILQEIMDDPHIAADGFTYEYIAMKTWLDRHSVSPVTRVRLENKMLTPNHVLRSAIQEWRSSITLLGA